ncbi:helix-turn-helix domain-containing protein [Pseudomonas serbica]|uniref:helix-turn-helix domain-containing protein n=1 Tax=Pseudomonas serbica TaxID=2965074 RepID=UPI00237C1B11|nr:helix-turn-helix transcriptional regulator [Pseudomonas serbica]
MPETLTKNRIENLKSLLEIHDLTPRKLSLTAGLDASRVGSILSGRKNLSDSVARTLEIALDVPPNILDQSASLLLESKAAVEQERAHAINAFLGDSRCVNRYWNVRDLMETMKPGEFSTKTGIFHVHCSQLFSKNPRYRVVDSRARLIEDALGLTPLVLDKRHELNNLVESQHIERLSTETIDILGTGTYLNRYLNIKNYFLSNRLTYNQIDTIVGFKLRASEKLADPPKNVIDTDSARAFERHFNLEPGAVDQFVPAFDYASHQSSFIIGEKAFNEIKSGIPLYRYVNTKRILHERGMALIEFVPMLERTKAFVFGMLSDSVISKIGDQSARRIEQALGLKPLSLDVQKTFRVFKTPPGSKHNRALSPDTDLQP